MLKVIIDSTEVQTKSGTSRRGSPYTIREQGAFLQCGREMRRLKVSLSDGHEPYAPGTYEVDDTSFSTGSFDELVVNRLVLKRVTAANAVPGRAQVG